MAHVHNPSDLDVKLAGCTATVTAKRTPTDPGLVVLLGTASDTTVPSGDAAINVHASLALSNDADAVAMLAQLLDKGIGATAQATPSTAAREGLSVLPFVLDASVTCTVKPVVLGLAPFSVTKTLLVPDLLRNVRPATAGETSSVAGVTGGLTMSGLSMTKHGMTVIELDVNMTRVAGVLPSNMTFTAPATTWNVATAANTSSLATIAIPRVCVGCRTDDNVHTVLQLSPRVMAILAAGRLVDNVAKHTGASHVLGLDEPLGFYATGADGTMCLTHEVIAAVDGPVTVSRAVRATMVAASHAQSTASLSVADIAKLWGVQEIPDTNFLVDSISMDGVDVSVSVTLPEFAQGKIPANTRWQADFSLASAVHDPAVLG